MPLNFCFKESGVRDKGGNLGPTQGRESGWAPRIQLRLLKSDIFSQG